MSQSALKADWLIRRPDSRTFIAHLTGFFRSFHFQAGRNARRQLVPEEVSPVLGLSKMRWMMKGNGRILFLEHMRADIDHYQYTITQLGWNFQIDHCPKTPRNPLDYNTSISGVWFLK